MEISSQQNLFFQTFLGMGWRFQGFGVVSIPLQSMGTSQPHSCLVLGWANLQEAEQGWHSQKIPTST